MKKKKNGGCNPHQNRVKLIKTYEAYSDNASFISVPYLLKYVPRQAGFLKQNFGNSPGKTFES